MAKSTFYFEFFPSGLWVNNRLQTYLNLISEVESSEVMKFYNARNFYTYMWANSHDAKIIFYDRVEFESSFTRDDMLIFLIKYSEIGKFVDRETKEEI